jgi:CHASE2 domain-containing sensor protein
MQDSKQDIFKGLLLGLAVTAILVGANKFWIEHTRFGHRLETLSFELFQGQFSAFNPEEELPVVVVDISDMPLKDGKKDREKLGEVIAAIAEQEPYAIGVDIVLSPENGKWRTGADPELINLCLELTKKGVPVFLGVDSEMPLEEPSAWLGDERFEEMAAVIAIYKEDAKRIPLWARDKNQAKKLPSINFALAGIGKKHNQEEVRPPGWLAWALETVDNFPGRIESERDLEYADALVNYSKLEAIEQTKLLNISAASVKEFRQKFRRRIVVLGNGTREKASDNFIVPGRAETVPGVYVHACAAYTLMHEPVYEFKPTVRLAFDILFSALVLSVVAAIRWQRRADKTAFDWHKFQRKLVWRGSFFILVMAVILVRVAHVLWLDLIFIVIALLLHPWLESKLTLFSKGIRLLPG